MRNTIILLCLMLLLLAGNAYGQKFEIIGGIGYRPVQDAGP